VTDQLEALLQAGAIKVDLFPPNSRYRGVDTATLQEPDGRTVTYLRRRIVPPPDRYALVRWHQMTRGERPDTIAAAELGDPLMSWQLCDANGVMWPADLVDRPGRSLRITLSEGVPGPGDDA
jgi:hypothetical protein